jgi:flagellar FliJ protein
LNTIGNFRLQPVLSYRERREETVETELAHLRHACRQEEDGLARIQEHENEVMDGMSRLQRESALVDAAGMEQRLSYLSLLGDRADVQTDRVEDARRQVEGKRQELVVASQEKRVLEKLKERNDQEALTGARRADNRTNDEISIVQFHLRRQGLGG